MEYDCTNHLLLLPRVYGRSVVGEGRGRDEKVGERACGEDEGSEGERGGL